MRLSAAFYARDALDVAVDLVGCCLINGEVELRITEVEAYRWLDGAPDTANHCRFGRTARNAPMWGPPGYAYIYLCYGIHWMLNLVTNTDGEGAAVLIRGAEVIAGHDLVANRRGGKLDLVGPGKVAAGLGLTAGDNWRPLFEGPGLEVHAPLVLPTLSAGPRIGIDYAEPVHREAPWRIADANSPAVAQRKRLSPYVPREGYVAPSEAPWAAFLNR